VSSSLIQEWLDPEEEHSSALEVIDLNESTASVRADQVEADNSESNDDFEQMIDSLSTHSQHLNILS
jgi:hypothetical protein